MSDTLVTQINDVFSAVDERQQPVEVAEILHTAGPIRSIDYPQSPETPPWRSRPWLVAVAAAVVILVLVGGVAWLFRPGQNDIVDEPTTTVPTTVVDTTLAGLVPPTVVLRDREGSGAGRTELVRTQIVSSSIGDLRWTAISDPLQLTENGIMATSIGFVSVSGTGELLVSDDAIEWRALESPFPDPLEGVSRGDANEYLMNTTGAQWLSSDFVTWNLSGPSTDTGVWRELAEWIDGPDFLRIGPSYLPAGASEVELRTYPGGAETPEGAELVYGEWSIDWKLLALQIGGGDLRQHVEEGAVLGGNSWDPATGIVAPYLWDNEELWRGAANSGFGLEGDFPGKNPSGVEIRMAISGDLDDWVIEFQNAATNDSLGSIVGSLPPLGLEESAAELSGRTLDDVLRLFVTTNGLGAYFLSSEDGLELVDNPPWVSLPGDWPRFVLTDNMLYAYYFSGDWQSPDGRFWQGIGEAVVPTAEIGEILQGPDGVLLATSDLDTADESEVDTFVRSDDGVEWALSSQPPELLGGPFPISHVLATDSGFIFLVYESQLGGFTLWTSTDGDIWEEVDVPTFGPEEGALDHSSMGTSSGNAVVITGDEAPPNMWIIEALG